MRRQRRICSAKPYRVCCDGHEDLGGYLISNGHYVGTVDDLRFDVDISAQGDTDDLEVTYKVTHEKP